MERFHVTLESKFCRNTAPICVSEPGRWENLPPSRHVGSALHYAYNGRGMKSRLRNTCGYNVLRLMRHQYVQKAAPKSNADVNKLLQEAAENVKYTTRDLQYLVSGTVRDSGARKTIHPHIIRDERYSNPMVGAFGCFDPLNITGTFEVGDIVSISPIDQDMLKFPPKRSIIRRDILVGTDLTINDISDPDNLHEQAVANSLRSKEMKAAKANMKTMTDEEKKAEQERLEQKKIERKEEFGENATDVSLKQAQPGVAYIPEGIDFRHFAQFNYSTPLEIGMVLHAMRHMTLFDWSFGGQRTRGNGGGFHVEYHVRIYKEAEFKDGSFQELEDGFVDDCELILCPPHHDPKTGEFHKGEFAIRGIEDGQKPFLQECLDQWLAADLSQLRFVVPDIEKLLKEKGYATERGEEEEGEFVAAPQAAKRGRPTKKFAEESLI